ncbi:MAG: zinc transporter ZupT [Gaiellaceae bacterium]|jgi:ZIP family zinc transporter|nr:zinc transporter ZupT [Gaiellaceae bacterium]
MGEAFVWGLVGGSSLVIGGVVALRVAITRRVLGLIMAFGAGVLISAVAYELVHEAFETSAGDGGIALGLLAGSAVFFGAEILIDRLGGGEPPDSGGGHAAQAGRALVLGIILDGIPESLVLGLTVLEAGTVSVAFLAAVFLANLPEAIAATTALSRAGRNSTRIIRFWVLVALGFGVTSLAGYVVLDSASQRTVAIVLAFAGGAVLTMLANTMMPEALHYGGKLAGFMTTLGFALAFAISSVQ